MWHCNKCLVHNGVPVTINDYIDIFQKVMMSP
uniref:Uncharacterized protein n=1 Tax=Anguilla anguilla TaxID=7936 RepID=A0A0E9U9L9_ANGAN